MNPVIVIPTLDRADLLEQCLSALADTAPGVPVEVVGFGWDFAAHCNYGAMTPGDPIVFLNDDTLPQPGWLKALVKPFDDPRVGVTGARLTYPDGRIQHAGVRFETVRGILTAYNVLTDEPSRYVDAVTGACMAVRRDAFGDGFDTGYRNGYEDVDLCLRVSEDGWRIWYAADSHVVHLESQSGPARWAHVQHNINRLQERWG